MNTNILISYLLMNEHLIRIYLLFINYYKYVLFKCFRKKSNYKYN